MRGIALVLGVSICAGALASEALFQAIDNHRERAALELLAGGKAVLETRNAKGDTPLHRAVETGLRQLTRSLLEAGADPGARTRNGAQRPYRGGAASARTRRRSAREKPQGP
jgi:ankyrin repeat protein